MGDHQRRSSVGEQPVDRPPRGELRREPSAEERHEAELRAQQTLLLQQQQAQQQAPPQQQGAFDMTAFATALGTQLVQGMQQPFGAFQEQLRALAAAGGQQQQGVNALAQAIQRLNPATAQTRAPDAPPFIPGSSDPIIFLQGLEIYFRAAGLHRDHQAAYAANRLQGVGISWVASLPQQPATWDDFKAAFRARFVPASSQIHLRDRLHEREMRQCASPRAYADEMQALANSIEELSDREFLQAIRHGLPNELRRAFDLAGVTNPGAALGWVNGLEDHRRQHYNPPPSASVGPVPMELGATTARPRAMTPEERTRCITEGRCFRCREKGHSARECKKKWTNYSRSFSLSSPPSSLSVASSSAPPSSSSSSSSSSLLYKAANLNGSRVEMLVDSGATHNFLPKRTLNRLRRTPAALPSASTTSSHHQANAAAPVLITLADGSSTPAQGSVSLDVKVDEALTREDFVVAPVRFDGILGMPWLKATNPHIDWRAGTVTPSTSACVVSSTSAEGPLRSEIECHMGHQNEIPTPVTVVTPSSEPSSAATAPLQPTTSTLVDAHDQGVPAEIPPLPSTTPHPSSLPPSPPLPPTVSSPFSEPACTLTTSNPAALPPTTPTAHMSATELIKCMLGGKDQVFLSLISLPESDEPPPPEPPTPESTDPRLLALLKEFEANLSGLPSTLPPRREVDHTIEVDKEARPPAKRAYRLSPDELKELHTQLTDLLRSGYIRPSKSPYAAPVIFVKKASGEMRLCVDFRALNEITIRNRYPLPLIDELLDKLKGAKYFSKLDLASGYFQIRVADKDVPKTAFTTRYGLFEWLVMPFGLQGAPATFMSMMNSTFHDYLDKFLAVYLDDFLIYSATFEEHLEHLRLVLQRFKEHQLFAKRAKCVFGVTQVPFLGYVVNGDGILTSPDKVSSIRKWAVPADATDLRRFLGLANFYHKFVKNFADVAAPLHGLLKKGVAFDWTKLHQSAFDKLKGSLCTAPVLCHVDTSKPFVIEADASRHAIGAVLSQYHGDDLKPVAFTSRKLHDDELGYPVHEKELLAIIHAVVTWRHYIGVSETKVITDHESLKFFNSRPMADSRQGRWVRILAPYKLVIHYRPGKSNVVADALSRPPTAELSVISTATPDLDTLTTIRGAYSKDPYFIPILEQLEQDRVPRTAERFHLKDGLLYLTETGYSRLCVPDLPEIRKTLLQEVHAPPTAGHPGFDKTYELAYRSFFWKHLYKDVKELVSSCDMCQRTKPSRQLPQGLLHPLDIPSRNWEQVGMDFITQLPRTGRGHDSIFVVVDKLSKYTRLIPTTTTITAPATAALFIGEVYKFFGMPSVIISDRDSKFTSLFWQSFFKSLGTSLAMSTSSHQETNGQTERVNSVVEAMLRAYINRRQTDWDDHLALVEFAINNTQQASTGHSPFFLNFGRHPATPAALLSGTTSPVHSVEQLLAKLSSTNKLVRDNLLRAQQKQATAADRHRRDVVFSVGDQVLVTASMLKTDFQADRPADKLAHKWVGPYKVIAVARTTVTINLPASSRIHPVLHVSEVKHYSQSAHQADSRPGPEFVDDDGSEHYVAERILDKRTKGRGRSSRVEYLIKWEGYPDHDATWEPLANLQGALDLVREFDARVLSVGV